MKSRSKTGRAARFELCVSVSISSEEAGEDGWPEQDAVTEALSALVDGLVRESRVGPSVAVVAFGGLCDGMEHTYSLSREEQARVVKAARDALSSWPGNSALDEELERAAAQREGLTRSRGGVLLPRMKLSELQAILRLVTRFDAANERELARCATIREKMREYIKRHKAASRRAKKAAQDVRLSRGEARLVYAGCTYRRSIMASSGDLRRYIRFTHDIKTTFETKGWQLQVTDDDRGDGS